VAEQRDLSGRDLIRAVALGFDIAARATMALYPSSSHRPDRARVGAAGYCGDRNARRETLAPSRQGGAAARRTIR